MSGKGIKIPAATATQRGLVKGGEVPGSTSGTAIAAGYVGEVLTTTFTGVTVTTTPSTTLATISSVTPGIYMCTYQADGSQSSQNRVTSALSGTATIVTNLGGIAQDWSRYADNTAPGAVVNYSYPIRVTAAGTVTLIAVSSGVSTTSVRGNLTLTRIA